MRLLTASTYIWFFTFTPLRPQRVKVYRNAVVLPQKLEKICRWKPQHKKLFRRTRSLNDSQCFKCFYIAPHLQTSYWLGFVIPQKGKYNKA